MDWLRLLKGYSPGLSHESQPVRAGKGPPSLSDASSVLDGLFIHLKVGFIKESL